MKNSLLSKSARSLKIALGAVLAIALASALGLQYPTTAGIITILSIQGTKLDTGAVNFYGPNSIRRSEMATIIWRMNNYQRTGNLNG